MTLSPTAYQTLPELTQREPFEALVTDVHANGRVSLRCADGAATLEGRCAVYGYQPSAGDRVLCTEGPRGAYVTGVLMAAPPELRAGEICARVEDGAIVLRGADGTLILSYEAETGVARISSEHTVIQASERIDLTAKEVRVDAERLVQAVGELSTEANAITTSVDRWELRANRIHERARNVFRDVESLLQTRAGTLRSIAREGMSLFARRTSIRSKKDTAVDGERVLLG